MTQPIGRLADTKRGRRRVQRTTVGHLDSGAIRYLARGFGWQECYLNNSRMVIYRAECPEIRSRFATPDQPP